MKYAIRWFGPSFVIGAVIVVAAIVSSGGSANSGPIGDQAGIMTCQGIIPIASEYGTITGVLRGETSTAAAVAYWQEHRGRSGIVSSFRSLAAETPVTVCLLSGQFVTPAGPPDLSGRQPPAPDVLRVLVYGNNQVVFDSAGTLGGMSPQTPSDLGTVGG